MVGIGAAVGPTRNGDVTVFFSFSGNQFHRASLLLQAALQHVNMTNEAPHAGRGVDVIPRERSTYLPTYLDVFDMFRASRETGSPWAVPAGSLRRDRVGSGFGLVAKNERDGGHQLQQALSVWWVGCCTSRRVGITKFRPSKRQTAAS